MLPLFGRPIMLPCFWQARYVASIEQAYYVSLFGQACHFALFWQSAFNEPLSRGLLKHMGIGPLMRTLRIFA
jgi:hypothetical protein